jgi:hypothetical protein
MWILILLAVNVNNANDIPGRITLSFNTQSECEYSLQSLEYSLKFKNFKVIGKCEK